MAGSSTPGPYKGGYWVVSDGANAYLVDKSNLPSQGKGWTYYWVGNPGAGNPGPGGTFFNSIVQGADLLGQPIPTDYGDQGPQPQQSLLSQLDPYIGSSKPVAVQLPHESAGDVAGEILGSPIAGLAGIGAAQAAAGGGIAGLKGLGKGAKGAAQGAKKALGKVPGKAKAALAAASLTALLGQLGTWKGVGLVLAGAVAILFSFWQLSRVMTN